MENTKKSLAILLFSLFMSFGLTNCKDHKGQQDDDSKHDLVKKPDEIIQVAEAKNFYDIYEKRRVHLIQKYEDSIDGYYNNDKIRQERNTQDVQEDPNDPNGKRFDVARYVYWDYDTIKNYLKYIEQEAKAANIEISTLRFYFSNYPEDDASAVHPRQNSIMITPTLHRNDREYIFSINDSDTENLRPMLLSDSFGLIQNPEKGMGASYGAEKRSYASFIPHSVKPNNNNTRPPFASSSVTMNKGNSAPPPHQQ